MKTNLILKAQRWLDGFLAKRKYLSLKREKLSPGVLKHRFENNMIKTIYILWLQGFENAPFIVKKCLESWIIKNPTWNIVQLDQNNLEKYINISDIIKGLETKPISSASLSDMIRISLLKKYGGLWVDATTYCNRPLDDWLGDYTQKGFFVFSFEVVHDRKPDRPISSWFIYGAKNNYIIDRWYEQSKKYCNKEHKVGYKDPVSTLEKWKQGNPEEHYFWFHYLFHDIYESDPKYKKIWDGIPKIFETGPHFLQSNGLLKEVTEAVKKHIDFRKSPLYKLTYRYDESKYNDTCNLNYLLEPRLIDMEIATSLYKVKDCMPNIRLIHIGKCGGTALRIYFKDQGINLKEYHLAKPIVNDGYKYIIWIRNPLSRFVSAFNHSYALVNVDISKININNLTIYNSLAPAKIKYRMQHDHTFNKEYDELIKFFKTANNLAEALSSANVEIKDKAFKLMRYPIEHIYIGIGWYLDNGELVKKHNNKILFVGKLETMKEDLRKLSKLLNISLINKGKVRENDSQNDTYLSSLAINNLLNFYQLSDYKALDALRNNGWIDEKTFQSYFTYRNDF